MPNVLYIVVAKRAGNVGSAYYAQGISPLSIPFSGYDDIKLMRMGFEVNQENVKDFYPIFCKFQAAYKRRYKAIHSIRWFLQRQLDGKPITFPLRNFLE